jgi:hypothetical protein
MMNAIAARPLPRRSPTEREPIGFAFSCPALEGNGSGTGHFFVSDLMADSNDDQSPPLYDLRLNELKAFARYNRLGSAGLPAPETEVVRRLSEQFDRDVSNLSTLARLPTTIATMTALYDQSLGQAYNSVLEANARSAMIQHPATIKLNIQATKSIAIDIAKQNLRETGSRKSFQVFPVFNIPAELIWSRRENEIDSYLGLTPDGHQCAQQFLETLCVRAWTIFEVLAGDLWVAALDSNPVCLGRSAAEFDRMEAGESDEVVSGSKKRKGHAEVKSISVPLPALVECGWNLSDRLGTYCKQKFNFQKFDKIKEAYECVWPESYGARIHAIFDVNLKEVAAIRNAIVHNGGKTFKWQVKPDGRFAELDLDKTIPLDGPTVNVIADIVIKQAQELLKFVDESLTSPADSQTS